jgi:hypothetical protein
MSEFEARLGECLEALREGRWDIDECLRRHPEHAAALRPHLLAAASVARAFDVRPRDEFVRQAGERFRIARGEHLSKAFAVEPEPSFFAAARLRFLMAAQRMGLAETPRRPSFVPQLHGSFRALASAAAALVLFLSFSTYTVASASSALPGDWRYPIKLQTERVRLALAFSDSSRRDVKLGRAEERAHEIEQLTRRGKIIGPGVLDRLAEQTQPLIEDAAADWNTEDIARLKAVAEREQTALQQAKEHVDADAQDEFAQAADVSKEAANVAGKILVLRPDAQPQVIKGTLPLDQTPSPVPPSATPEASATPGAGTPTAAAPTRTSPAGHGITIEPTPVRVRGGIIWNRLAVGRFTTLIPSEENGWHMNSDGGGAAPALVKLSNVDGTSLVTLNPRTGDMFWFIAHGGRFDEVQMRLRQPDGEILVADGVYLRTLYGEAATVPLYVLANIELQPAPTPEPTEAPTGNATPAAP